MLAPTQDVLVPQVTPSAEQPAKHVQLLSQHVQHAVQPPYAQGVEVDTYSTQLPAPHACLSFQDVFSVAIKQPVVDVTQQPTSTSTGTPVLVPQGML